MKNRKWMALALAAAMVGSLTACGGGSGTADTTAAAAAADTTAAPAADTTAAADAQAPAGDGTGLVYWSMWESTEPQGQVIKEAVDKFSADTGVAVDVQFKGRTGIREGLQPALDAGTNIDLFDEDIDRVNTTWGAYLMDLEELAKASDYDATANASLMDALETGPDGPVPAPDLTLRLAALLHDIGKPKTRRFEAGGKVSFHRHDAVGAKMTRKRLKALHFDHHMVEDVSELVNLHLRFHGYVEEPWTDSAVRRYVKDAGPLYERLNRLTRADTTTQNKRKAMMFSAAMDEMEQRVRDLKEKEDFDAIRPDLNGDEIMQLLSIEPGPMVGKAYKHMLEYRLDNGPVERDVAVAELERWYKEQGE